MNYDILNFLTGNRIDYTENDSHYVTNCPFCDRENHLYINTASGMFDCKVCGVGGPFKKFIGQFLNKSKTEKYEGNFTRATAESYAKKLEDHTTVKEYLFTERRLSPEIVKQYLVGVNDRGDISIPHFENDKVVGMKFRYLGEDPNRPKYYFSKGSKPTLFNNAILKSNPKSIIIVEGEFDLLAGRTYGIKNIIASPGAAFKKFDWGTLSEIETIYICYDSDDAGQKGAYDIASRLTLSRCKNIKLPENDLNECLKKGIPVEKIRSLIQEAEPFDVPGTTKALTFSDSLKRRLLNPEELLGYPTGFEKFDKMTGGLGEQQLTVLSGVSSAGKTTFSTHLMYHYARQNIPVKLYCLESPIDKILVDLIKMRCSKDIHDLSGEDIDEHAAAINAMPLYFYDTRNVDSSLTIWKLKQQLKEDRDRYGIKFAVIDDMQFILNTVRGQDQEASRITKLMFEFKELANTLNIHIMVVVHVNREGSKTGFIPKIFDLKGGSGIEQSADYVIFVHRDVSPDAPDEVKENVDIAISKNRIEGSTGVIHFKFDPERSTYHEI